tara:strand:+ start:344 stop:601 length:258 start_codon:yes stop_codon:yes gene_type:complete
MLGKKKMCLIVKSEETFGISLWVNQDFDEEYNSPVMKKLLKDFPKSKRRVIFPQRDEVEMMNEGKMKVEPNHYLTSKGNIKSVQV